MEDFQIATEMVRPSLDLDQLTQPEKEAIKTVRALERKNMKRQYACDLSKARNGNIESAQVKKMCADWILAE